MASELKLEVAKEYRAHDGGKFGPMLEYGSDDEYFHLGFGIPGIWHKSGRSCDGRLPDLIAEWPTETTGPVRTVTRKEIVPGSYGGVEVTHVDYATEAHGANVCIRIDNGFGTDSLRDTIATLTEIADALEDGQ